MLSFNDAMDTAAQYVRAYEGVPEELQGLAQILVASALLSEQATRILEDTRRISGPEHMEVHSTELEAGVSKKVLERRLDVALASRDVILNVDSSVGPLVDVRTGFSSSVSISAATGIQLFPTVPYRLPRVGSDVEIFCVASAAAKVHVLESW